ncbi:D-2-hydroxyacid dehydrogenase [Mycobacterium sp. AMU20-3851]|uniref:D-2-hydroxyacid dehydrogenase n=1 Tax=Mycobacterium sp. AMU20-3851 TaxID=3122055 RepID=UPI0037547F09
MSPLDVLIASYLPPDLVEQIAETDPRLRVHYHPELLPEPRWPADHVGTARTLSAEQDDQWTRLLASADVLFDFDWRRPAETLTQSPRLRWVQATAAGVGTRMATLGLRHTGLTVTTASGVHAGPLAEFALAGILYFARDLPGLAADRRDRLWHPGGVTELAGRHALIVGAGQIGTRIAELLAAFDVTSTGVVRRPRDLGAPFTASLTRDQLAARLPTADILVVAAPITDETEAMIGARQLAALPDGAIVVNVGRGATIDEDALVDALRSARVRAAVLDVTRVEPLPPESPLWDLDSVILSPHAAANAPSENAKIVDIFTDNLRRFLDGSPLRNLYDHAAGY